MTTVPREAHLPALDEHHRHEVGHELQATLVELVDLSLIGKQLHWNIHGRPFKPLHEHLRQFELFAATCVVLPVDARVADEAATIWAHLGRRGRRLVGDILIAATASVQGIPLVTRNRRDFEPMTRVGGVKLGLVDWHR